MTKLPKLYNIYKCYDDGKITTSRQYDVLITNIIKWDDVDEKLKKLLEVVIEEYDFLYKTSQEYVIYGVSYETIVPMIEIFLETKCDGWFGIGEYAPTIESPLQFKNWWCSGKLDVNGECTDSLTIDKIM